MSLRPRHGPSRPRRLPGAPALFLAAATLLACAPVHARAQGVGTDIITGVVTGDGGAPLADAVVEAFSLETEITRRATTDARGRYTILFPDGSGQYRMTARMIGFSPRTEILVRRADDDRLVWNARLVPGVVPLETINVRTARTAVRAPDGPTPGAAERAFNPDQLARLPLDVTDITALASMTPGVLGLDATDSTAAAFSVAGLGPDANALTLDGLLFGAGTIPQDAVRQTRVITSTYDVSRGQFSGGLIAATTRGGSNVIQGSSQYQLRDQDLAVNEEDTPFGQGFTQHLISGGIGGPVARDRLFIFLSGQARLRSDPQQTLLSAGSADFTRLGVAPDSVTRFLGIVGGEGIPPAIIPPADTRTNDNYSGLLRLDYLLSNSHTVTLRGDWRGTSLDPTRLGPLALPQTGGNVASSGGGVMATLSSRFGAAVINEFHTYLQGARNDGDALLALPQGRVQVASALPDGAVGVTTLVFGGNPGLPTRSRTTSLEATDELSWLPGARRHRFKVGGLFLMDRSHNLVAANQYGTYTYLSLAALEANQPASFRRTLQNATREAQSMRWGFYAGDVWMASRPLQLTYGVRLDGSGFRHPPAYNAAVDTAFGRRTDLLPREWHVSPRVGFTLALGNDRPEAGRAVLPAALVIRGGVGEFRSPVPANLVAAAQSGTGLANSAAEIFCIGPSVPAPDWGGYLLDPSTIPDQCASGPSAPAATRQRTVTLLAPDFEAPRAWRASLGVQRSLTQLLRVTVDWSWSRGVSQSGFRDLNLVSAPSFTLADEGGRPVFVPAGAIAPATGTPRFSASRRDTLFGSVLEARSNLASRSNQLTVGLGGIMGRGIVLNTSYTWMRTRDQATGLRGGGGTAGDPNVVEWARSNFERRHNILATITYPFGPSLEVTSIGRLTSGAPYAPTVGGDVNGDGSSGNDRAFIFAPGAGTVEAGAMQRLLGAAAPRVRDCLLAQVGRVAGRNTCTGPWQGSLEFQVNWRPTMLGLNRRLMVSVVTQNFLRGVDELLHGTAGAKGWGLTTQPDGRLLYVTGFDTLAQRYTYQVNERFGATNGSLTAFRPPFQIGVQMRLTIGPDRARRALDQLRAGAGAGAFGRGGFGGPGGGGGGGGPGANPEALLNRLESLMPNPAEAVLELRDTLRLDSAQIARLQLVRDSLGDRNHARADSIRAVMQREGTNADPARLFGVLRPQLEAARADILRVVETVHGILTDEQWVRVPDAVKTPTAPRPVQARPGGPGRPGGPPRP